MRKIIAIVAVLFLALGLTALARHHQDKSNRASPPATATLDLGGGKSITVEYSSPRAKGRAIYGGLVPYGKLWRTGANEPTTLATTADVTLGGSTVPAGRYALFTIPDKDKWVLIISKKITGSGLDYPGPSEDLARVDMKVSSLKAPVENFTISFDKSANGGTINFDWETTRASAPIAKK